MKYLGAVVTVIIFLLIQTGTVIWWAGDISAKVGNFGAALEGITQTATATKTNADMRMSRTSDRVRSLEIRVGTISSTSSGVQGELKGVKEALGALREDFRSLRDVLLAQPVR